MDELRENLIKKITCLPDDKIQALASFMKSLDKEKTNEKKEIFLSLSGSLSGEPLSSENMDAQLYGEQ